MIYPLYRSDIKNATRTTVAWPIGWHPLLFSDGDFLLKKFRRQQQFPDKRRSFLYNGLTEYIKKRISAETVICFLQSVAESRNETSLLSLNELPHLQALFLAPILHDVQHQLIVDVEIKRNAGSIRRSFIATYDPVLYISRSVRAVALICRNRCSIYTGDKKIWCLIQEAEDKCK